jgi:hypothetical protein
LGGCRVAAAAPGDRSEPQPKAKQLPAHHVARTSASRSMAMQRASLAGTGLTRTYTCRSPFLTAASSPNSFLHAAAVGGWGGGALDAQHAANSANAKRAAPHKTTEPHLGSSADSRPRTMSSFPQSSSDPSSQTGSRGSPEPIFGARQCPRC